jgi:hypothetical protein
MECSARLGSVSGFGKSGKSAQDGVDQAEYWTGRATLLIFVGIALEIFSLFLFPAGKPKLEIAILLAADAAIGIGLIVEYFRILAAIRANAEVKQKSDAKLAGAIA